MRVSKICGLIGVIGDSDLTDKKVFDLLLKLDTTRGKHSTGVARVPWNSDKRSNVEIVKSVGTPWDLIDRKPREYYNDYSGNPGPYIQGSYIALMGHNRWATVGEIIDENAHPFEAGKIVGMQNGTLSQASINKLDDHEFYDTDTEALMFNIDLHGIENVIPKITGAWALTWYNREEDSFNILRNKERPLLFAWKKNKKVMYYASEAWMLYAAIEKFGVDLYVDDKGDCVWQFLSDTHYKFSFPKNGALFNKDNAWEKSELKGYTPPPIKYKSVYTPSSSSTSTNRAKDSANVFVGKYVASSNQSVEYWVKHRDEFVEFTVDGTWAKDEQGKSYICGEAVHDGAELRIYPSAKHPNLEFDLGNSQVNSFAAKIKKIKVVAGKRFYLTIDYDTLVNATYNGLKYQTTTTSDRPSDKDLDDDIPWERIFPQSMGRNDPLDQYEQLRSVERGCCWCSYTPHVHEIPNIEWIAGSSEFLCEDCASNPEVKQYMAEYVPA